MVYALWRDKKMARLPSAFDVMRYTHEAFYAADERYSAIYARALMLVHDMMLVVAGLRARVG